MIESNLLSQQCGDAIVAQIAQSVEQRTENPRVTGSIPVLGMLCGCSSMVEHQPSKLDTWVRFPSPALENMREWLSGGVSPCQGEGRGFESRLALFFARKSGHGFSGFLIYRKDLAASKAMTL